MSLHIELGDTLPETATADEILEDLMALTADYDLCDESTKAAIAERAQVYDGRLAKIENQKARSRAGPFKDTPALPPPDFRKPAVPFASSPDKAASSTAQSSPPKTQSPLAHLKERSEEWKSTYSTPPEFKIPAHAVFGSARSSSRSRFEEVLEQERMSEKIQDSYKRKYHASSDDSFSGSPANSHTRRIDVQERLDERLRMLEHQVSVGAAQRELLSELLEAAVIKQRDYDNWIRKICNAEAYTAHEMATLRRKRSQIEDNLIKAEEHADFVEAYADMLAVAIKDKGTYPEINRDKKAHERWVAAFRFDQDAVSTVSKTLYDAEHVRLTQDVLQHNSRMLRKGSKSMEALEERLSLLKAHPEDADDRSDDESDNEQEEAEGRLKVFWDCISHRYIRKDFDTRVSHLFPSSLGPYNAANMFGQPRNEGHSILWSVENGLTTHKAWERCLDEQRAIALVPDNDIVSDKIEYKLAVLTLDQNVLDTVVDGKKLREWDGQKLKFLGDGRPGVKYAYFHFAICLLKQRLMATGGMYNSAWYTQQWADLFSNVDQDKHGNVEAWYDRLCLKTISIYLGTDQDRLMATLFPFARSLNTSSNDAIATGLFTAATLIDDLPKEDAADKFEEDYMQLKQNREAEQEEARKEAVKLYFFDKAVGDMERQMEKKDENDPPSAGK